MTGLYTSNYNVTFYDMDYNNVPYTTEYAVKLTNQPVTVLPTTTTIIPSLTFISSVFSSSTNVISSSPSTILDESKLLY